MIVWPSGGDFTTISVPIVPDAPGLFSTKNGWSKRACSLGASSRATMSGPAAGVNGTTIRTGRLDIPWASAPNGAVARAASAATPPNPKGVLRPRCRTVGTALVQRSRESAPAQQVQGLGTFGHDVRHGVGNQSVGLVIFHVADGRGETEVRDEEILPQVRGVDIVGHAGPVLERKAAEMGKAPEHLPDAGRELRVDAAELRIQIRDLWHGARLPTSRHRANRANPDKGFPKTRGMPSPVINSRSRRIFMVSGISVRMLAFVAAALAAVPLLAPAQPFPHRAVKIVVPTSPGGATDAFSRALAPRFSEIWGQPVLVENRPGANQIVGAEYVSKSAPDGATLLVSDASSFVINPHLYKKLPYNGLKSFTPITVLVRFPWVIAVHASVPANTFEELVALAKAKPGSLSYGSFGLGSSAHISVDYLKNLLGLDIVHVPYKGAAPAVTDLLSGQIQMMMVTPLLVESHARAGRLKLVAAATARRIAGLPELPTVAESGVPGYEAGTWFALMGPAGMPRGTVDRIYDDTAKILLDPVFRERYVTKQWFEVVGNTPEQFAEYIKSEYARWARLIELSRVSVE